MGGGFLPTAIKDGKLYFLFGKENKYATTPGYADFGGGTDKNESFMETALREFTEETTGFFGSINQLRQYVSTYGTYNIDYIPTSGHYGTYRTHILPMKYNEAVVFFYNNNQKFLQRHLPASVYKQEKFFEKSEMKWFCIDELKQKKHMFRPYYRNIIDLLLRNSQNIEQFIYQSF
jgi:8-oxo-dGTP pyrophosphatase MutT (NUDIX family)